MKKNLQNKKIKLKHLQLMMFLKDYMQLFQLNTQIHNMKVKQKENLVTPKLELQFIKF